jgi:phosphatidate cytidylyltransferase
MNKEFFKRTLSSLVLFPTALFFIIKGSFLFSFFIIIFLIISFYEWHMMSKKKSYYMLGFFFLISSFYSIYLLRNNFEGDYFYLLFVTTICVSTDIGGYIFGKIFKGPKLIRISPKKTYSGMIGGYFLSIISINFFLGSFLNNLSLKLTTDVFIFVLIISTFSQIGDILISYFKRLSQIKDTGKLIPGHGGLLDRIDGMIFAFPISYLILLSNTL